VVEKSRGSVAYMSVTTADTYVNFIFVVFLVINLDELLKSVNEYSGRITFPAYL
jgi:hypothetical protein